MDSSRSSARPVAPSVAGPRRDSRRDRRGRGMRGPAVLPGPLTPRGVPLDRSSREVFDSLALEAVRRLEERWHDELGLVEFAVEEAPIVDDDWDAADSVPLASLVRGTGGASPRVVLFRRPLEHRAESRTELGALVLTVLVEQVAEMLGRSPEEIYPDYDSE